MPKPLGKRVRIGYMDYEITQSRQDVGIWGKANACENTIAIDTALIPEQAYETFWHEVIHVSLGNIGLSELSANEVMVQSLAFGICQVLHDNPWVRRFYEKEAKSGRP